jgi:hypothetical protein
MHAHLFRCFGNVVVMTTKGAGDKVALKGVYNLLLGLSKRYRLRSDRNIREL